MKIVRNMLLFLIFACLVFASCAQPAMQASDNSNKNSTTSIPAQAPEKPVSSPNAPSAPTQSFPAESSSQPQEITDIEHANLSVLPLDLPVLTEEDNEVFNPKKVISYFIADMEFGGRDYCFNLDKAELKDGRLYLDTTLYLEMRDIDTAYQYLKEFPLSDNEILQIPLFAGCVIHDSQMYNSKDTWEDRKSYSSYDEWAEAYDREEYCNSFDLGEIKVAPMPVAQDAKIQLLDDEEGSKVLTPEQFIKRFLHGKQSETDFTEEGWMYTMDSLYFTYANGEITSITQTSGDI